MIKIIKVGDVEKLRMTRRFECKECGTIFECDKEEYKAKSDRNDIIFYAPCPVCFNNAYHVTIR